MNEQKVVIDIDLTMKNEDYSTIIHNMKDHTLFALMIDRSMSMSG